MKKVTLYIGLVLLIFSSCESRVSKVRIPQVEPKLVVQCFISPEAGLHEARITWSSPVFNSKSEIKAEPSAKVWLSDGTQKVNLVYDPSSYTYKADTALLPIVPGKRYFFEATSPDGKKVSAECVVPHIFDTASVTGTLDSIKTTSNGKNEIVYLNMLSLKDWMGAPDYYRLVGKLIYRNDSSGALEAGGFRYIPDNGFKDDNGNDGGQIEFKRGEFKRTYIGTNRITLRFIEIQLMGSDEHYYRYHKTTSAYNNDNPFSEPVFIYSNINGGLGCFGAYRYHFRQIEL